MGAPLPLAADDAAVVEDYLAAMRAAGRKTGLSTTQAAHTCQAKIGRGGGWGGLTAQQQLDAIAKAPSFTSWLMVTGRITVDAELLSRTDLRPGLPGRRFCAADYHWFTQTCSRIGISSRDTAAQWNILAKITAITGAPPCAVTDEHFDTARVAMTLAYTRRGKPTAGKNVAAVFHRLRLTLFHAGRLSTLRRPVSHPPVAVTGWATVAPGFAESAHRYVEQVTVSLRASTVKAIEHDLREFGTWLADTHPEVGSCADLHREHIEAFKTWLCTHPTPRTGAPLNRVSIKNALINLHCFFTRITEWGYPNPPVRPLLFPGDLPIIDKPLPRFLDDAAAAKLLRATRADPDPLSRLIVELLARTGIRRGELLALTADAVVQIGSAYWLRIPIGKLHNDRYIPLHPQLKQLLDDWITHHRPTGLRTNRLLLEHNRPISQQRVTKALRYAADTAGIGNVTAHQLRHTLATQAVNRGMSLDAIAALLGHYGGDFVKCVVSGGGLIESSEQSVEHFLAAQLSFGGGVVALRLQGGAEFDGGLEEGAGFADGFEVAVQADGSGAVAVAEHPAVHLDTELTHFGAFGVGGQCARLVVEGFDLCADGEVFVGDGAVGDTGVHEGHPHRSVPQQGGQGFESHAAVDRLGRQCVPEAMGRNMADASRFRGFGDCPIDPALADALAVLDEQVAAAQAAGSGGDPGVEEILELGMQGDVAVGAQFPQRHVQPVRCPDLHHGIDCEVEEFTLAQAGAGQELHAQADERVVVGPGGLQQLGERGVVEEAGQRVIAQRQVAGENEHPGRDVVAVPFGEAFKAGTQGAQVLGETGLGQPAAAGRGPGGQVQLVGLDMCPTQVGDADHPGSVGGQPAGELPQHALDAHHRRGPQRQPCLGDVTGEGGRQPWWDRRPLGRPLGRAVRADFAGCTVKDAEVEQRGLRTEQRRAQRLGAVAAGSVASYRRGQRFSLRIDHRLGQPLGSQPGQRGHLDQRRPLQARHDGTEPELGGGRGEPFVELAVMVGGDFAEVGPTRHQIVRAGPQPSRHDQPTDYPSILERQRALRCQRQTRPAVHPHSGEERARHRRHRVSGEHPGRDEVGPVRRDELLDVGAMCR